MTLEDSETLCVSAVPVSLVCLYLSLQQLLLSPALTRLLPLLVQLLQPASPLLPSPLGTLLLLHRSDLLQRQHSFWTRNRGQHFKLSRCYTVILQLNMCNRVMMNMLELIFPSSSSCRDTSPGRHNFCFRVHLILSVESFVCEINKFTSSDVVVPSSPKQILVHVSKLANANVASCGSDRNSNSCLCLLCFT